MIKIPYIIVILGATATGKTKLAVRLAKDIGGEIISADSRQIYKGLDIGTGKDLQEYKLDNCEIAHHLIDIRTIDEQYSVYDFQRDSIQSIEQIMKNNKIPIVCGGTGLYIEALLLNYRFSTFSQDQLLRDKLSKMSIAELESFYKQLNISKNIEKNNRHRYIRAIEIAIQEQRNILQQNDLEYEIEKNIVFGIRFPREILRDRIYSRLINRLQNGMIEEVNNLLAQGTNAEKLISLGLEYKYITKYLLGELTKEEMVNKLYIAICQFAKRQETWFRRMERRGINIYWINGLDNDDDKINEMEKYIYKIYAKKH
ncbi:MAG: tRNA (adenosine(37)-N6)-dimethylallyltransferase MiaA [Bacteroidales bacterium]|nr:tRNA (adenosine(37)-N6)-dimethylallyltransferase MiaA [Bacteroidales bacterium]